LQSERSMSIFIPIDFNTVRRQPPNRDVVYVAGRPDVSQVKVYLRDGMWHREEWIGTAVEHGELLNGIMIGHLEVEAKKDEPPEGWINTMKIRQPMSVLRGLPSLPWSFEYVPTEVTCESCERTFLHTKLESADDEFGDDYYYSDCVCPFCYEWDCCDIQFEQPDYKRFAVLVPEDPLGAAHVGHAGW